MAGPGAGREEGEQATPPLRDRRSQPYSCGGSVGGSSGPGSTQQSRQQQPAPGPAWEEGRVGCGAHTPPLPRCLTTGPVLTPCGWRQQLPVAGWLPLALLAGAQLQLPHVPHHGRGIEGLLRGERGREMREQVLGLPPGLGLWASSGFT